MSQVSQTELRARFARALSDLYGREVPAYTTLVEVASEVNRRVLDADPTAAQRLGSIERVTAERHGAIRLGSPQEMAQVAQMFAGFGMHAVGFYDLREASGSSIPVTSTAFRPTDPAELAQNPFRVFTSMLMVDDERFFDAEQSAELHRRIDARCIFSPELLALAERAEADGGLDEAEADEFVRRAAEVFALSSDPVDRQWYTALEKVSAVAADIGGVSSTHINHLTPRVLDIDALYAAMTERGITMIDKIQGPPGWAGPDVLLRQTSFKALAEPRAFREADGTLAAGDLRVRFGEVEQRGIALTRAGRAVYDEAMAEISAGSAAEEVWARHFPADEQGLAEAGYAFFSYRVDGANEGSGIVREPIVYEDFLPQSAAGIFASNLSEAGSRDDSRAGTQADLASMSEVIGREVADPFELYAEISAASLRRCAEQLGENPDDFEPETLLLKGQPA